VTEHLFRAAAAADIENGYSWYERERIGLGDEFLEEVSVTVDAVLAHPNAFPIVHRDTRRALVRRFPFALYYRIVGDTVVFVACFHVRRNPLRWTRRR
jgi:plasmid stabilization system protein ParE